MPPPLQSTFGKLVSSPPRKTCGRAFSLIEMLAATAILAVLMLIIFGIIQATSNAWKQSTGRIESLQNARASFESVTRRLSQATLNTYYAYFDHQRRPKSDPAFSGPDVYGRQSELHFVSGKNLVPGQITHAAFFQAPLGYTDDAASYGNMDDLVNACGYYLTYSADPNRPAFLTSLPRPPDQTYRYRLMEYVQPSQHFNLYTTNAFERIAPGSVYRWIAEGIDADSGAYVRGLGTNIVALIFKPERPPREEEAAAAQSLPSLAPNYDYDSRVAPADWRAGEKQPVQMNQLPQLMNITMVAIDEASAIKLGNPSAPPAILNTDTFFQAAASLGDDLARFEGILSATQNNVAGNKMPLSYRVFQTTVAIRGAKWSN